ncbi:MAG: HNH endonuclease [Actinomycetota bacterium]|nr:HNH endonuclease [Actinomycetota bacterium]
MPRVLVLNASYQPLNLVNVKRAVILVLKNKAEIIEEMDGMMIRSEHLALPLPSVIRLVYFVKVPYRGVSLSRRAVFARDNHTCQYCGGRAESIDHVIPRSRGGGHTWENVVAACRRCNTRKMNRLPSEAGLKLSRKPIEPQDYMWILTMADQVHPTWEPYLETALVG